MRFTFESVEWVKQIAPPNVVAPIYSVEDLNSAKRLNLPGLRGNSFWLTDCLHTEITVFSCLWIWTKTSAPPEAWSYSPSDWNLYHQLSWVQFVDLGTCQLIPYNKFLSLSVIYLSISISLSTYIYINIYLYIISISLYTYLKCLYIYSELSLYL